MLERIGLLQHIGGMEGLQVQSTPKSFHLNFLRLGAVQGQFQKVIGLQGKLFCTYLFLA